MSRIFRHPWGWATVAPLACAVHCAATPLVVVFAPTIAESTTLEWSLLVAAVVAGSLALATGVRSHDDLRPAVPVVLGLTLWGASLMRLFLPVPEELTTVGATLIVAGGLFWNSRLHCARRALSCAVCSATDGISSPARESAPEPPTRPAPEVAGASATPST